MEGGAVCFGLFKARSGVTELRGKKFRGKEAVRGGT